MTYAAFRAAMAILAVLPAPVARRLGEVAGLAAHSFGGPRRAMAERHARRAGLEPAEGSARMFAAYGRYWAEALWIRPRRRPRIERATRVDGIEHVRRAKAEGTGMIYLLPHLGNWEVAAAVAAQEGIEVVAVAEDLHNRRIRDWFIRLRNSLSIGIILARPGATRAMEAAIGRNAAVALLSDRDLSGRGVRVSFFGEETTLPAGGVRLSLKTGAPLLPVACFFDGPGHHLVVCPPLRLPATTLDDESTVQGVQLMAHALEDLIRRAPDQWHLVQPNWPSDREGR